jgi:entry exclusion lipoprotein TrbK
MSNKNIWLIFIAIAASLAGCGDSPESLPEVNKANCKNAELIKGIKSPELLKTFQRGCATLQSYGTSDIDYLSRKNEPMKF